MKNSGYVEVDHIADLAIRVWGKDFITILTRAAEGLYALMRVKFDPTPQNESEFILKNQNHDQENLLVDFLNELLFLSENDNIYLDPIYFIVKSDGIVVRAKTHKILTIEREIKAVTYHELEIIESDKGLEITVTFDI